MGDSMGLWVTSFADGWSLQEAVVDGDGDHGHEQEITNGQIDQQDVGRCPQLSRTVN